MSARPRGWLRRLGTALRDSTDAGLLAVLRTFGLLYGRIDRDLRIDRALKKAWGRRLPKHVGWRHALGGIAYLLFMVLVATGVLLVLYYRPSVEEAYSSIQVLVSEIPFGWLIRDLHVWSATLIVIVLLAHMARVLFAAAYRPPRESAWFVGVVLLFVVLAFGGTGYLLPWDQWSYWTVAEFLQGVSKLPIVGAPLAGLLMGDVFISGATLSRFFAIHVVVLPWVAFGLLSLHFVLVRKHGVAPPRGTAPEEVEEGHRFFPDHLLRSLVAVSLTLAVAISLAALYPKPVGEPATPFDVPGDLESSWIVVDVSLGLFRHLGVWGFVGFTALGLGLVLLPLFDRDPGRGPRRLAAVILGTLFFAGFVAAWIAGSQVHSVPEATRPGAGVLEERAVPLRPPADAESAGSGAGATGQEEAP